MDAAAYGEDWDGLKELVENSNIQDKNLILQVLSLYSSSAQRESEIKNMASVFNELKSDVLPKLRRSKVVNSTDLMGKTDAEIMELVNAKKYGELSNEELLYAAESLVKCGEQKVAVLEYTAKQYKDVRAYNNLGIALAENGDQAAALKAFEQAAKLGSTDAALSNNLALANLANGNVAEAAKYSQAADKKAKALAAAAQGNYSEAARNLTGINAAIAYTMNKDYAAAKNAIAKETSAEADYLRAVIAQKEGDLATAKAQLNSAIAKNPGAGQESRYGCQSEGRQLIVDPDKAKGRTGWSGLFRSHPTSDAGTESFFTKFAEPRLRIVRKSLYLRRKVSPEANGRRPGPRKRSRANNDIYGIRNQIAGVCTGPLGGGGRR